MQALDGVPYHVLAAGSKTLIADEGLRVVLCTRQLRGISWLSDTEVEVGAGEMMPALALMCRQKGLSGVEFMGGIPGTIGGGLRRNAGAFGGQCGDCIQSVLVATAAGLHWLTKEQLALGYRTSGWQGIAVAARWQLLPQQADNIQQTMESMRRSRAAKQPADRSVGSVFVNPPTGSAAQYIEACGLKGLRCGGAKISEKHGNFIVNCGNAATADFVRLADTARQAVAARYGVRLQNEYVLLQDAPI